MTFDREDPSTWPLLRAPIIAHDVGGRRDHSTAVIGGHSPFDPGLVGVIEAHELPQGLYGSARASALAAIDRQHRCDAIIVADLSYDPTYAEALYETFGRRVVGLHISSHGQGMEPERRVVNNGIMLVYTIGRSYLFQLLHTALHCQQVRMVDDPMIRRAYEQLVNLETELRPSGVVYACPPGQHDDLGISLAMLVWAARHPHLPALWLPNANYGRRPRIPQPPPFSKLAWT